MSTTPPPTDHNGDDADPVAPVDRGPVPGHTVAASPVVGATRNTDPHPVDDVLPVSESNPEDDWTWVRPASGRRRKLTFSGHVRYVDGAEGERLRSKLGAVLRELLEWAYEHRAPSGAQPGEGVAHDVLERHE